MSQSHEIYLDANATVPPFDEVIAAVRKAMRTCWGNPSSEHSRGIPARRLLTRARDAICALLPGTYSENVVLTSGGTEGSNAVFACAEHGTSVIVTEVEHPATMQPARRAAARGAKLTILPVSTDGQVDPDAICRAVLDAHSEVLVSVQWANGETGVVQPVQEIAKRILDVRPDTFLHVDAAQAVGRMATPAAVGVSALTFSGHKLHGPQGTGALVFAGGAADRIPSLLAGGGQETNRRSGTQNVAGAAGLAAALEARARGFERIVASMRTVRDRFEDLVQDLVPGARINGIGAERVPNTSSIRFPLIDGMALVARLDQVGVRCSQGSACSSGRPEPSHVLRAMGHSEDEAYSSVRFSFSALNSEAEAEAAARMVASIVKALR